MQAEEEIEITNSQHKVANCEFYLFLCPNDRQNIWFKELPKPPAQPAQAQLQQLLGQMQGV